jgi:hypothetical protein
VRLGRASSSTSRSVRTTRTDSSAGSRTSSSPQGRAGRRRPARSGRRGPPAARTTRPCRASWVRRPAVGDGADEQQPPAGHRRLVQHAEGGADRVGVADLDPQDAVGEHDCTASGSRPCSTAFVTSSDSASSPSSTRCASTLPSSTSRSSARAAGTASGVVGSWTPARHRPARHGSPSRRPLRTHRVSGVRQRAESPTSAAARPGRRAPPRPGSRPAAAPVPAGGARSRPGGAVGHGVTPPPLRDEVRTRSSTRATCCCPARVRSRKAAPAPATTTTLPSMATPRPTDTRATGLPRHGRPHAGGGVPAA